MASYLDELKKRQSTQTTSSTPKSSGSSSYLDNLKARTGQTSQSNPTPTGAPVIAPYNPAKIATGAVAQGQFKPAGKTDENFFIEQGKALTGSVARWVTNYGFTALDALLANQAKGQYQAENMSGAERVALGNTWMNRSKANTSSASLYTPAGGATPTAPANVPDKKTRDKMVELDATASTDTSYVGGLRRGLKNIDKAVQKYQDLEDETFLAKAVYGAIESTPYTAMSRLNLWGLPVGGALNYVVSYKQNLSQKYEEAIAKGETPNFDEIQKYATIGAAIDTGTEYLFPAGAVAKSLGKDVAEAAAKGGAKTIFTDGLVNGVKDLFKKETIGSVTAPTLKGFGKALLTEGGQELTEEEVSYFGQAILAHFTTNPDDPLATWRSEQGGLINVDDAAMSGLSGFLGGVMFSGVAGLKNFKNTRAVLDKYADTDWRKMTPDQLQEVIKTANSDIKYKAAQEELDQKLATNAVRSMLSGRVLQDQDGNTLYMGQPDQEGRVALFMADGGTYDESVTIDQINQLVQGGKLQELTPYQQPSATPAAQAVNASSLPGQQAPAAVPTAATSAGVAPTISAVTNAQGKTVNQAVQSFPTKGKQQGQVAVETDGKKIQVTMQIGAVPYTFEIGADTYAKSNNKLQTIELASKGNQLGMLSQFMARNVDGANMQAVWSAVQAAVDGSAGDYVAQTQAAEQAKVVEQQAKQAKAQADQTTAQIEQQDKPAKAKPQTERQQIDRKTQQWAVDRGEMDQQTLDDLKRIDEEQGVQYNETSEKRLTKGHKAAREILKASTGKEVVFIHAANPAEDRLNGYVVNQTADRVYINSDVSTNAMKAIGHELFHLVDNAGHAKEFIQAVLETTGKTKEELINAQIEQYAEGDPYRAYLESNREQAFKEAIADRAGEVFSSTGFLDGLKSRLGVKKFDALIKKVKEWLDDLRGKAPAAEKEIDALLSAIEKMRTGETAAVEMTAEEALADTGLAQLDTETKSAAPLAYSYKTWNESDYVKEKQKAAKILAKALGVSEAKATKYIDDINGVAKMIADDRVRLDYEANPNNVVLKPNSEYVWTVDMSTLCTKRLLFTGTMDEIQKALPNTVLTSDDVVRVREVMQRMDLEVACGICYVESTRREIGAITQGFIDEYKRAAEKQEPMLIGSKDKKRPLTIGNKKTKRAYIPSIGFTPTLADLNTADGLDRIQVANPDLYNAYVSFMNARGQAKPKLLETRAEYNNDIRKHFNQLRQVDKINKAGGLRAQSYSDFEVPHLIDMMQIVMDMSRVGLKSQAYTKVAAFADIFGGTGIKINLSLIAKGDGVDADGNLIFDDVEGIKYSDALRLRAKYSADVGTILVGKNDKHIITAMADPLIDFIIPFHKSSWKESLYAALGLTGYADYTEFQNEKWIDPYVRDDKGGFVLDDKGEPKKKPIENYSPTSYWDYDKTGDENAQKYLAMCKADGRTPKFQQFQDYPGYWKLLIDFKMYDNDGKGAPQMVVRPEFDMDAAEKTLAEYKGGHHTLPVAREVVDQMVDELKDRKPGLQYSMKTHRGTRLYTEEFLSMGTLDKLTEAHKYYDAQSNKKTLALAAAKIQANPKAAEMEARQIDQTSAVATALRMYFMFQADMLGDHQASADWAWVMVKAAKNAGQAVQAHKMVNRMTPQGIMLMLHHELNSLLSDEAQAKINQLTVGIVNQINRYEEESLKGILPSLQETIQQAMTPDGRIAQLEKKLQNMEQDLKLFEHDPVLQYIRALHSVASRVVPFQDLPKSDKPTDFLKWAIKNKDKYPTMWEMAYDITAATRGLDSNYIKEVEAYFRDFLPKKRQMKFDLNPRRYEDLVAAIKAHYAANDHSTNALVNRLMEIGVDPADSALIADTVMQAMAELTKTQKARIVKRLLPPQNRIGKKNPLERLVNLSNEHGLTDADVRATAAHILGLPSISPEMAAEISGLANEIAAIREASNQAGVPLTEEQQRAVDFRMAMLLAKVQAQKPVSIGQKIETFRYMMMLSMFKSMERNIIGNGLFAIADTGKDFTAAILDRAIFGKNAVVPWPDFKGAIEGAIRGAKYSYEDIMNEVDTSEMDTQYSIERGRVFNNKFMRMQMKIFRLQMSLPDRISQTAAYESHLQGLMKLATKQALRNGTTPPQYPTAAMKEEAVYFAQKKTFTDDNLISTTFGKMRKVLNQISTLGASETWGLGSVIMPFTRVPGALLMRTIDYSPVSVIRAAVYLGQFGKEVATSVHDETWKQEAGQRWRTSYQKKFSTALADGIFGSAVTLILGYWLRSLGIISGEPPEDKKVKNLRESMGLRGYQLNWSALRRYIMSGFDPNEAKLQEDDILTPYSWAAPMSLGLSIGANYHDASKLLRGADIDKVDKFNKLVMMATLSGTETIANMSLMSGVSNFIQSQQYVSNFTFVEGEESRAPFFLEPFLNAAVSYPSSFIHNGIKAVREMTDNVQRNSYARDYGEYALNLMWNRIPGMSKTLPPRYDVLGNLKEVYRDNGNNVWNVFFNPTWVEKFKPNPTAVTILNMMAEKEGTSVQSKNITPAYAPRSITYKDANGLSKPYQLTPDEQSEFQRIVGVRVQQEFAKIPAGWPMEEQVKAMNEILNAISNEEKDNILKRRGLKN